MARSPTIRAVRGLDLATHESIRNITKSGPHPGGGATTEMTAPALRKGIRTRNAVALYVSSVLGSGILVLPGLAAQIAGPASLVAWALLALASIPFAFTFASLSARRAESGGVLAFAREAFGRTVATVTGWLFMLWVLVGAPAVALIAASYLQYAFTLSRAETYLLGFAVVAIAFLVNLRGIVLSSKVQLAVILSIIGLLVVTLGLSGVRVQAANFQPFAPDGLLPIGTAAALIFWSFLGYENVSNVGEEFEDPKRDFPRSVGISIVVVGLLYFAVAAVTVGTGAYRAGGSVAPFAALLSAVFGPYGAAAAAILAVIIVFAVVNAYTTGMSRVMYATALQGGLPRTLAHLSPATQVPDRALLFMFSGAATVFLVYYLADVDLAAALLVASGSAITVYIIGSAAGVRLLGAGSLLGSRGSWFAAASLVISVIVLPFIGIYLLVTVLVVIGALLFTWLSPPDRSLKAKG